MDNSPLADLSGELRNLIYEYALYEEDGFVIDLPNNVLLNIDNDVTLQVQNRSPQNYSPRPALLETCRAVRQEAMLLYYAVNHLNILMSNNGWDDDMEMINGWLDFIGYDKTKHIEHAILRLDRIAKDGTNWYKASFEDPPPAKHERSLIEANSNLCACRSAPEPLAWKQFSDMLNQDAKIEVIGKATYVQDGFDRSIELTCRLDKRAPPLGDALIDEVLRVQPDFKKLVKVLNSAPTAMRQELSLALIDCFGPTVYLSTLRDTIVDGINCGLERGSHVVGYRFRL